ncbi:MarR family winged helix-turn-helix transcriptional regulator [Lentibacillus sp. Marseille-P4043]|uniref:MarR family winged helix-turn-helix transcriptional regulator n=1 Tax=Lentibacillus sp. Marseille-P4043 TaxID=2040293 RepID=UPI000D0BAE2C|nr:MarR family transcriptional regulator [Lentibacillus sp. Marseille-P4043]
MVADDIRELLDKLCARRRRSYSSSLRPFNVYVGQDHALRELWKGEGVTQSQLSERMGCEPLTVTNMIKKLEDNGLISRQRGGEDGRVSRVYLTSEGRALQQPVQEVLRNEQEKMLDDILPEERLLLHRLLQQMVENISK